MNQGQETQSVDLEISRRRDTPGVSLDVARAQQARGWELRTATSYARLLQQQDRPDEARALLQPIYDWFTEGFDTKDLSDAKAVLSELAARQ